MRSTPDGDVKAINEIPEGLSAFTYNNIHTDSNAVISWN